MAPASNFEIQANQKDTLFELLELEKLNPDIKITGLERKITRAKAVMSQEDIAHVEKLINSLSGKE